ncbi:MAG: DUF4229 domain-containing protein [Actinomycetota bacterium]|nr:DUF4229 domain-containing protein [Actinomycetota bacterium]
MFRAVAIYTVGRIAIFAVLLAVLWAVDLGSFPGILFALLLSMPASYFLLGKQREDLAAAVIERREARARLRDRLRGSSDAASDGEPEREQEAQQ